MGGRVGAWVAQQAEKCTRCQKSVYAMERCVARRHSAYFSASLHPERDQQQDEFIFHKACFRCADCNTQLQQNGGWELADDGAVCCKVHFAARRQRAEGGPAAF